MFKEATLSQLSAAKRALLEKRLRGRLTAPSPDQLIQRRAECQSAPLSFAQQRLWFLWQMDPDGYAYNVPAAFRLKGHLDLDALARSFNEIVRRHEALRTSFRLVNEEPRQLISPALVIRIPVEDLQHLPPAARQREAVRRAVQAAQQPFDLERLPLLRVRVLRLDADEHVLLVTMHHIVTDGWSLSVLVRELGALYEAYASGREPHLPSLELQYADYAEWQRGWLRGEVLEEQLGYWRRQLGGSSLVLEMPTDHVRPAVQRQRGAQVRFALSVEVTERLRALSRREGVTMFMTLLAAFQVLLSRYAHQTDIIVGSPIANRTRREIEGLIGFFVNTLALRIDLSGAPCFRELLGRVGEMTTAAYAHQELPFEKLVEELQPERDMSRSPLFQVMFALLNMPMSALELPGLSLSPLEFEHGATRFDLECHLWEYEKELRGLLVYSTDLFEETTMRRLLGHFESLLDAACARPDERITTLPLLTPAEEQQLLVEWNDTATEPRADACVHQLFASQAAHTPDRIALSFNGARLTYSELNTRANMLAHYLRRRGIGAESIVGICLQRSVEMIVSLLGVLKAGGAYLPLDPQYPQEHLGFMVEDAGASLLLTRESPGERLSAAGTKVVYLERIVEDLSAESVENPQVETTSDNLAYVIYTSGSTGRPKAVMMPHGPLVNLLQYQMERSAEICHSPRTLQFASLSFDVSFQEIFSTLCAGGELLLIGEDERRDICALLRLLRAAQVERLFLPFIALQHLAEVSAQESLPPESLREVVTAGEQLKITHYLKSMFEKLEGCALDNHYGPSESHVASAFRLEGAAGCWPELPPIGRPIANTQLYALDEEMQLVPLGVTGELFIGGGSLSRGYLSRADATAEKFIPHPFSRRPGARLYRTGDVVRRLPDGNLEFLGRNDEQVKVRGYRIEPGEVEAALAAHPAVGESVVQVQPDSLGERRLVAYVAGAGPELSVGELREFLGGKLPDYMLPSVFVLMDRFPLTPSGKVNRQALPPPQTLPPERASAYAAPETRTEQALADIWTQVLGVEQVGTEDNFFELGGHSLLATQALARARRVLGVEIPLRQLFEQPTVKGLARYAEDKAQSVEGSKLSPPIVSRRRDEHLPPLSFAQQRLWFIDQLFPQSAAYNLPTALRLEGALDIASLKRSFNEIIRRHETLRTTFSEVNGQAVQVIAQELSLDIQLTDLRSLSPSQRELETRRLVSEEAQRPFDLQLGPLVRAQLLRLEELEYMLLVTMHHIVTDGWSLSVLVRELGALYEAYASGREPHLPSLELQYADYAEWQRGWLRGEVLEEQLGYWRRQLGGSSLVLEMPTDHVRPAVQRQRGAQLPFIIQEATGRRLNELSQGEGVTMFMTLLAAFQVLLSRYAHQTDIIVGSPIANRTRAETEHLIGFFVNTLVLRTDLSGDPEFRELMRRVREVTLGAYAHQELPFEKLVEELQPERDMSRSPLFQVMFMLQNEPIEALALPGLEISPVAVESQVEMFDLTLIMRETDEGLRGALSYNTDLFDETTMRRMCARFERLLEGILADPRRRLSELPLLTEEERRQLLVEWNDTHFEEQEQSPLLQGMFEAQARRTPHRVALVYEGARLDFGELDRRANKLANRLVGMGVGPETIVGVMMERSLELVVALLGVLKAGGAYLPLDPEYPGERLDLMLEDSGAQVLLTQSGLLNKVCVESVKVICPDEDWETIARESAGPPTRLAGADNPAYVIYTSGSTGRPKGVLISHRAICNRLSWGERAFPLNETDRILQSTSISFDVSVWELFAPLLAGAALVLAKPGGHQEIAYLADLIEREAITILNVVPSLLQVLIEDERFRRCRSLRRVFVGGEAMPVRLPSRFFSLSRAELYNLYGPTEATIDATCWKCSPDDAPHRSIPIGRPIGNLQVYLLDEHLRLVPAGLAGELYIGGPGLARGYLGRPDLTAERFIPDPYGTNAGARLYRTGDLARYLPGGVLEFLRRADDQVKIRGFRIETGEIEAALLKHPSVKNVVVRVSTGGPGRNRLAPLDRNGGPQLSSAQLSALDRKRLLEILEEIEMLPESEQDIARGPSN
jgi:amino acid adenylation domain-containing protein